MPNRFQLDELPILSNHIEFVDPTVEIDPVPLAKTTEGRNLQLGESLLYLRKNRPDQLGDERLGYSGILVPVTATYFGKYHNGVAVADESNRRDGVFNQIIGDSGNLHHLVAGDRATSLSTVKSHLIRTKWIFRGVGSFLSVLGLFFFCNSICRLLYHLPLIGTIAEMGGLAISLVGGVTLALLTITFGYLAGHPLVIVVLLAGIGAAVWFAKQQSTRSTQFRSQLENEYGQSLDSDQLKRMEYKEMASLLSDEKGAPTDKQSAVLDQMSKHHDWDHVQQEAMLNEVKSQGESTQSAHEQLTKLIRLAVADNQLTPQEVKIIREAATAAGYDRSQFRKLMGEVQQQLG